MPAARRPDRRAAKGGAELTAGAASITALIGEEALDAELAALLWLLLEAPTPVVVCGPADLVARRRVMAALIPLSGADAGARPTPITLGRPDPWGPVLRARLLALWPAEPFALIADADSLLDLMATALDSTPGLTEDELRALGLVVVVGAGDRIDAAHLLRPVERDGAGHLQRRPPAVLAARDPRGGRLEDFAWGVMPELADRIDREQTDLERRRSTRADFLAELAAAGIDDPAVVELRLAEHLRSEPPRRPAPIRPPAGSSETGAPNA